MTRREQMVECAEAMKHLGDITKINWFEVEPVDCVTGGSPCQDLSVAGKRAGLAGERSGLYMEQIRCIKELRQRDIQSGRTGAMVRPRWMVWENVPGAFSSNGGKDFAAVLEEAVKIVEPQTPPIPVPDKGWPSAGCLSDVDGRWSIAWRVHDAQFWGVPQRRKRIALVCDFGGMSAPEVLFERKGLSRDTEQSGAQREETARTTGEGVEGTGGCLTGWDYQSKRIFSPDGICATLNSGDKEGGNITPSVFCLQGNGIDRADTAGCNGKGWTLDKCYTLNTIDRPAVMAFAQNQRDEVRDLHGVAGALAAEPGMKQQTYIFDMTHANDVIRESRDVSPSLQARMGTGWNQVNAVLETYQQVTGPLMANSHPGSYCGQDAYSDMLVTQNVEVSGLDCRNAAVYAFDSLTSNSMKSSNPHSGCRQVEIAKTLDCADPNPSKNQGGMAILHCYDMDAVPQTVRRLTPLECERLQGYPDGWTDIGEWIDSKGKKHKAADSPRYKALGNSIALPFWFWLLRRISAQYERPATLGSLFDGIGGFPLCWERCNGDGTALWASEIEEFPMAVTKMRFGRKVEQ